MALRNWADGQGWQPKTRNEALAAAGLLFKEGEIQHWVADGFNPAKQIKRLREIRGAVDIFEAWETKQLMDRIDA